MYKFCELSLCVHVVIDADGRELPKQSSTFTGAKVASARKMCKGQRGEPSKIGGESSFLADELYAAAQLSIQRCTEEKQRGKEPL